MKRAEKQLAAIEADFAKNLDLLNEEEFKRANEARREEQAQLQARLEELASSLTAQSLRHDAIAPTSPRFVPLDSRPLSRQQSHR